MNCKQEFLEAVGNKEILCVTMECAEYVDYERSYTSHKLKTGFTKDEYISFCDSLDFEYDDYDDYAIYGIIWYKDGTWSSRIDVPDVNGWVWNCVPSIPNELR